MNPAADRPVTAAHLRGRLVLPPLIDIVLGYVSSSGVYEVPMSDYAPGGIRGRPRTQVMCAAYMGDVELMVALLNNATTSNRAWNSCFIGAIAAGHVALLDWLWTYRDSHAYTHFDGLLWKCGDNNEVCAYCRRINSDDVLLAAVSCADSLAWLLRHRLSKYAVSRAFDSSTLFMAGVNACKSGRIDSADVIRAALDAAGVALDT